MKAGSILNRLFHCVLWEFFISRRVFWKKFDGSRCSDN